MNIVIGITSIYIIPMREHAVTSPHFSSILFSRPSSVVTRPATTRFIGQRPDTGAGAWNIESLPPSPLFPRRECPRRRRARGALLFLDFHISTFHHSAVANIPRDPALPDRWGGSRELSSKRLTKQSAKIEDNN